MSSSSSGRDRGEVLVVKCGGSAALDRDAVCADLAGLARQGRRVVLVHGGAAEADALAGRLGVPQRRLRTPSGTSSRYTDPATLDVVLMALLGRVKPQLVAALTRHGAGAVGLTGADGKLLLARRSGAHRAVLDGRTVMVRDDLNGRLVAVDPAVLAPLLDAGLVPVISPPAIDTEGTLVNVDADRAAAAVAVALAATARVRLVLLTAAPGVLADAADEHSLLPEVCLAPEGPVAAGAVGGMTVKLQAARTAVLGGVRTVTVADGRGAHPVTDALTGAGTTVRVDAPRDHLLGSTA